MGKITLLLIFFACGYLYFKYRRFIDRTNRGAALELANDVLLRLNEKANGKVFLGSESTVVLSKQKGFNSNRQWSFEQLCWTKEGHWFVLEFEILLGMEHPINFYFYACSEDTAKGWLKDEPELYKQIFGPTNIEKTPPQMWFIGTFKNAFIENGQMGGTEDAAIKIAYEKSHKDDNWHAVYLNENEDSIVKYVFHGGNCYRSHDL